VGDLHRGVGHLGCQKLGKRERPWMSKKIGTRGTGKNKFARRETKARGAGGGKSGNL